MFLIHLSYLTGIIYGFYFLYSSEHFILRLDEFYLASIFNLENENSENNEKLDETLSE